MDSVNAKMVAAQGAREHIDRAATSSATRHSDSFTLLLLAEGSEQLGEDFMALTRQQ